jgi:hypothetical protein
VSSGLFVFVGPESARFPRRGADSPDRPAAIFAAFAEPIDRPRRATMKMTLQYDAAHDLYVLTCIDVRIDSVTSLQEWATQLRELLNPLPKKVYLAIDIRDFHLSAQMAPAYGPIAKEVISRYSLGAVRFGSSENTTRAAIRLQASLNQYPSNIMPDLETAVAVLQQIRELSGNR